MIKDGVYRLKKDSTVIKDVDLKRGQEIEVVNGLVYMGGYPLPSQLQPIFVKWLSDNKKDLIDDTRNF